jgi:hypothetical protein
MRCTSFGFLLVMSFTVVGCGAPTSPSPLFPFVPGPAPTVYTGTAVDSRSGSGTLTVSLVGVLGLTSGTWEMSFGGKADPKRYISGTVSGNAYTATFSACPESDTSNQFCSVDCRFSFAGSLSSSSLVGTYAALPIQSCQAETGSISVNRH